MLSSYFKRYNYDPIIPFLLFYFASYTVVYSSLLLLFVYNYLADSLYCYSYLFMFYNYPRKS